MKRLSLLLILAVFILHPTLLLASSHKKVLIVGAGLAGLTSAYHLEQLGYEVEVFEARARPGGRVCTAYFAQGHEELGGKNISDGGPGLRIRNLIHEMHLSTQSSHINIAEGVFLWDKKIFPIQQLMLQGPPPTEKLHQRFEQQIAKSNSLAELISPLFKEQPLKSFMDLNIRGFMGSSSLYLSPYYLDEAVWSQYLIFYNAATDPLAPKTFVMEEVSGGNSLLIQALEKRLHHPIHYNRPLRKISYNAAMELSFEGEQPLHADYLILAIPSSTLRDVTIAKNLLPEDQMRAIQTQQYGTNAKILIPFQSNQPLNNVYNGFESMGVWLNYTSKVMTCYYGGSYGNFRAEELDPIFERESAQIRVVYPSILLNTHSPSLMRQQFMAHYDEPVGVSWQQEEFSKGSYSNLSPEQYLQFNEIFELQGEKMRSVYRPVKEALFFAGEHTSLLSSGTMEGAVESGEKAARLLDFFYKEHQKKAAIECSSPLA